MSEREKKQENTLPESLREGYAAFQDWRDAMARAGHPLPPGGVFILNRTTVTADALQILWAEVALELKIPATAIRVDAKIEDGQLKPVIELELPEDWVATTFKASGPKEQKLADEYVASVIKTAYERFHANLEDRIMALSVAHPELGPSDVIDAFTFSKDSGRHPA